MGQNLLVKVSKSTEYLLEGCFRLKKRDNILEEEVILGNSPFYGIFFKHFFSGILRKIPASKHICHHIIRLKFTLYEFALHVHQKIYRHPQIKKKIFEKSD